MLQLYGYFRSSAAYRVRIALNYKGLPYDLMPVHLTRDGGEQFRPDYVRRNPQSLVPMLTDGEAGLTQSLAIIEYLEETHPEPHLLPEKPVDRARVRAIALAVACDIHPLNNLRVLKYLVRDLGQDETNKVRWYHHWIAKGLTAIEAMLADDPRTGLFCHGDRPTIADVFLVPQVANARRFDCDLSAYPTILAIDEACRQLPAFAQAAPENQPDAE